MPATASDKNDTDERATGWGVELGESIGDASLALKVKLTLLEEFGSDASGIEVQAHGDEIQLAGLVRERSTRELAAELVQKMDGIDNVKNDLSLTQDAPARDRNELLMETQDAVLESRAKSALIAAMGKHAFAIEIEAASNAVTLFGTLDSKSDRDRAVECMQELQGVDEVIDRLEIAS